MACFLVPAAEAVVTTAAGKILEKHENKEQEKNGENTSEIRGERFSYSCFSGFCCFVPARIRSMSRTAPTAAKAHARI